jgi:hypothetical protein
MLIILYHFYVKKDVDLIKKEYELTYEKEIKLVNLMKSKISERPKSF